MLYAFVTFFIYFHFCFFFFLFLFIFFFFFFSSRRRHTRSLRDWSSDVCSSDLRSKCRNPHQPPLHALGDGKVCPTMLEPPQPLQYSFSYIKYSIDYLHGFG